MSTTRRRDVVLTDEAGIIVATHEHSGIASQGETEAEALENLADALRRSNAAIPEDAKADADVPDAPWF